MFDLLVKPLLNKHSKRIEESIFVVETQAMNLKNEMRCAPTLPTVLCCCGVPALVCCAAGPVPSLPTAAPAVPCTLASAAASPC